MRSRERVRPIRHARLPTALLLAFLAASGAHAGAPEVADESLQARIEQVLAPWSEGTKPGAAVLVTREGRTIVEYAVGMADLEHGIPITADSVFHVASDTKRFTAASICRLVERGKLSFDDSVSTHLPETAPLGDRITIDQMLSHTSGLRDQWSLLAMAGWQPEDVVTQDQVLSLLYRQESTNFPPGERQMYSNSGYTLLAEIVSRVADVPFADFVRREFFEPNGMSRTRVRTDVRDIVDSRVESYVPDGEGRYLRRPVQYEVLGATALLTSARDLARWIESVHAGTALTPFERATMLAPRRLADGEPMTYAYGLFEHDFHGHSTIGHGGGDGGFRSYFLSVPDVQLGVIVLANTPDIEPNGLAHDIARWALAIELEPDEPFSEEPASEPDLDALVGSYRDPSGRVLTVRRWFDRARLWDSPESFSDFRWNEEAEVLEDDRGRSLECDPEGCRLRSDETVWEGRRVEAGGGAALREFEGIYRSRELGASYRISTAADHLVARSERATQFELTPGGLDFFDGSEWYALEIRFVRDLEGEVRGFMLSSSRAFDVYFARESPPASDAGSGRTESVSGRSVPAGVGYPPPKQATIRSALLDGC